MARAEVERQRDAIDRVERLLVIAQGHPDTPIGDQTVIAEILAIRVDLLAETQSREETEINFVVKHELEAVRKKVDAVRSRLDSGIKYVSTLAGAVILAVFGWWLNQKGGTP